MVTKVRRTLDNAPVPSNEICLARNKTYDRDTRVSATMASSKTAPAVNSNNVLRNTN